MIVQWPHKLLVADTWLYNRIETATIKMTKSQKPPTPILKKAATLFAVSCFIFAMIGGLFNDFLPSREVAWWGRMMALPVALIMSLLYWLRVKTGRIDMTYDSSARISRWKLVFFPIGFFFLFELAFVHGFPWMAHHMIGENDKIQATVKYKNKNSRSGYGLQFIEYDYLWYKRLTHIPRTIYDSVEIGDVLTLDGTRSIFGFLVYRIYKNSKTGYISLFHAGRVILPIGVALFMLFFIYILLPMFERFHGWWNGY